MTADKKATEAISRRYNRIAPVYDMIEGLAERSSYRRWRRLLWDRVEGENILEAGVGTGKNFPYYPAGVSITAVDFSEKMLKFAREKARRAGAKVDLKQMDVQDLKFEDDTFDTVVGSCVFCSVPDPLKGLDEVRRVLKPNGKVVLLEHVLSANRIVAGMMNLLNPLTVRLMGPNINRRTVDNVIRSGLAVEQVTELGMGIFKLIEARKVVS